MKVSVLTWLNTYRFVAWGDHKFVKAHVLQVIWTKEINCTYRAIKKKDYVIYI